jgi:predicted nucleic acid-binding protein
MVIDTNIFIEHLRAKDKSSTTLQKIPEIGEIYISVITIFELFLGAINPGKVSDITILTSGLKTLDLTDDIARLSAEIHLHLKRNNQIIDYRDIFIASSCIYHNLPLLTHNKRDFSRIPNLKLVEL